MTVLDRCFPLGLGTTRFPVKGPNDIPGIEMTADWVLRALESGVNYIDVGHHYSSSAAETVLKHVFRQTARPYHVTVKSEYGVDKTADGARRRVENSLAAMGIGHASFFIAWTIHSYDEFEKICLKGGIYDGALKMKDEGVIGHICFSTHASPEDTVRILKSGAFEGVTVSYSLLNSNAIKPVLDEAYKLNIGVAVMNPLGGGMIPQNRDFFAFAQNEHETNIIHAALRFVKAHPAVKVVLSGAASWQELEENLAAFTMPDPEPDEDRLYRVSANLHELKNYCTGCRYCEGCHKGIPIPALMQSRNTLLFTPANAYNRSDPELLRNIQLFGKLEQNFAYVPKTTVNPCIRCGRCEAKCTQHLKVCDAIDDVYKRAEATGFSLSQRRSRLEKLLLGKGYKRVGLYPNGGYANKVLELYRQFFGEPDFEVLQFNSNPKVWGTLSGGLAVHSPDEIPILAPDAILVCSYRFGDDIFESLRRYEAQGIRILKLHGQADVPWVY
jgi:uncharacterized protein